VSISVFLADRQVLFREGIHFTLSSEEDIEVIGEANILNHIAEGGSSELVARALGIGEGALRRRLSFIRAKLVANEHNRAVIEAVLRSLPSIISEVVFRAD